MKKPNTKSYVEILAPNHPSCNSKGYVFEHRLVIEKHIGRYLTGVEVVHHINEIRKDNNIKNLQLCKTKKEHSRIHNGWWVDNEKWFKNCPDCNKCFEVNEINFSVRGKKCEGNFKSRCRECSRKQDKRYKDIVRHNKDYRIKNAKRTREWTKNNKEKKKQADKEYAQKNKEKIKKYKDKYRKDNIEKIRKLQRDWHRNKVLNLVIK